MSSNSIYKYIVSSDHRSTVLHILYSHFQIKVQRYLISLYFFNCIQSMHCKNGICAHFIIPRLSWTQSIVISSQEVFLNLVPAIEIVPPLWYAEIGQQPSNYKGKKAVTSNSPDRDNGIAGAVAQPPPQTEVSPIKQVPINLTMTSHVQVTHLVHKRIE